MNQECTKASFLSTANWKYMVRIDQFKKMWREFTEHTPDVSSLKNGKEKYLGSCKE